ncbi:MAG: hypothetical protein M1828_002344 [Chrysothrix sp. TS-e1954]|nr:MAG: hypothetical protein M1828_002344 [Chrysothrix sp. TS-e1954]
MDSAYPHHNDPVRFAGWLYERLHDIRDVTWDDSIVPVQSSYGDLYTSGLWTPPQTDEPSSAAGPLRQAFYRVGSTPPTPGTDGLASPGNLANSYRRPQQVWVRLSRHRLRLERQYQVTKTEWEQADPEARHHVRALQLYRLPALSKSEPDLAVILYERCETSLLRDFISYGPGWFKVSEAGLTRHFDPQIAANGEDKTGRIDLRTFLEFAVGACACCEVLHQSSQGVHGEVRGDSFHFDRDSKAVRLLNVGTGSQSVESGLTSSGWGSLSREFGVEYKLQFIAPEQTGRVQSRPDTRTDIYSLGIVFWNVLTGELPFQGATPLEIMQNVLSRRIATVSSKRLDVPDALSHVVSRMLQKNIEERYRSVSGLKWDLEQIQLFLQEGDSKALRDFEVGGRDVNSYFVLPNVHTGRQEERRLLLDVIEKIAQSRQRTSMISPSKALTPVSSNSSMSEHRPDASLSEGLSNRASSVLDYTLPLPLDGQDPLDSLPEGSHDRSVVSGTENSFKQNSKRLSNDAAFSITSGELPYRSSPRLSTAENPGSALFRSSASKFRRKGRCEVVCIFGAGGVGKSSLVQSVGSEARTRGFFTTSKFDQTKSSPFEPVLRLLSSLFRQIFTEADVNTSFHTSFKSFIRPVWNVLHHMLSLPEWLLDSSQASVDIDQVWARSTKIKNQASLHGPQQQSHSKAKAHTSQTKCGSVGHTNADFLRTGAGFKSSRFIAIYLDVLRFICSHRGVTLCIEDLQFADEESLELIQGIISSRAELALILTFRERKTISSALQSLLDTPVVSVTDIDLKPLSEEDITEYVSATLHRSHQYSLPLTAVILEKTRGNPFFMREILDTCHRKGCLWYSWKDSTWRYDLDKVFKQFESTSYGSQISNDYLVSRLKDLSSSARLFLTYASLLGNTFSYTLVAELMQRTHDFTASKGALATSLRSSQPNNADLAGQSSHPAFEGLQSCIAAAIIYKAGDTDEDQFNFVHDRYQQAACCLVESSEAANLHFQIASTLISPRFCDDYSAYVKASHITSCLQLIKQRLSSRADYRDVLFFAAEQATESGGRTAGLQYFRDCLFLLQDKAWDDVADASYQETLSLTSKTAECYFFKGHLDAAITLLHNIFRNARNHLDKVPASILKSRILAHRADHESSWLVLRHCLEALGLTVEERCMEECDKSFQKMCHEMQNEDKSALCARPSNQDETAQAIGAVLCEALASAFWSDSQLYYNLIFVEIDFILRYGLVSQLAGICFVHLATIAIGRFDMVEFGWDMGNVALKMFEKFKEDTYSFGRGQTLYCMLVGAFGSSTVELLPVMEQAMQTAMASGDRFSALLVSGHLSASKLWASHDVLEIENFCSYAAEELFNWQEDFRGGLLMTAVKQTSRALMGKTDVRDARRVMTDAHHDSEAYVGLIKSRSSSPERSLTLYNIYKLQTLFMFGHYETAVRTGEDIQATDVEYWSSRFTILTHFYLSLSYMAVLRESAYHSGVETLLDYIKSAKSKIQRWCAVSDVNFSCYAHILAAELFEHGKKYDSALQSYEAAQDHAELHNMAFEQALASELCSEFMIRRGVKRPARHNLREAITLYESMSAYGKAEQVAIKHEWLLKGTSTLRSVDSGTQTSFEASPALAVPSIRTESSALKTLSENFDFADSSCLSENLTDRSQAQSAIDSIGLDILDLTSILQSSQVLSSELDVDRLLSKMTRIILSSSGGDLSAIVVSDDDEKTGWNVAAISDAEGREFPAGQPLDNIENIVSKKITLYALRFREPVFLDNVLEDERFSGVPSAYKKRNPDGKAIICLPLLREQSVLGAVYLEGPSGSLTERNVHVLRMLAHSISISITNAKLFKKLGKVSANNAVMIDSQKHALEQARESERKAKESEKRARDSEIKAKAAEIEAMRSVRQKEEAVAAKTTFLANTSHELRTPLNGVIGMSELLKGSQLTKEQEGFADSIRVCADTLLTVINDILDFSKLEAGKMQIFSVPLSLNETIREVVRALAFSMRSDLQTVVDLTLDESLLVMGDPVRLHQILMNLLSNAYKFTQAGHVKVSAIADKEDENEVKVTCSVSDTGVGISNEQKKKLFLPFSQADSSTARSYGGTGLGLSICKAIIEKVLRGKIWLQSELGVGTTVFFSLTFQKVTKATNVTNLTAPKSKDTDPMAMYSPNENGDSQCDPFWSQTPLALIPRDQLRCAIAEDNPINQKIAKTFVQKLGLKCEAFPDGRQAVDAIIDASSVGKPFHVVLMDVQMPVLDGYNATREIRKYPDAAVKDVLIIAMTASAIRGDREKCLEAGMNNYLAKPVRQQVLKQMLDGYIKSDSGNPQDARLETPSSTTNHTGGAERRPSLRKLPTSS